MREIRFIHCADLHIDSPFKGLSEVHPKLRDILYESTYQSYSNIINLAISEGVDCVLITGDVYDGADKSLQAQLRFRDGLQRLADAKIPSFVIYGNHDPLDSWSATLKWPDEVTIFGGDRVEQVPLVKDGKTIAHIYGISFSTREVRDNLALKFERLDERVLSIGLLHTNVGENTGHEAYAPASIEDLCSRRMDYWALGHVHNHRVLKSNNPAVVYPGNSQARNPRETGPKGCCLVTFYTDGDCKINFVPTDVVRYKTYSLDISDFTNIDDVIDSIKAKCEQISEEMDGRHVIVRLSLNGRLDIHHELQNENNTKDILTRVREYFEGNDPLIWIEKFKLNTSGNYNLEELRQGNDFIADIISLYDELGDPESGNLEEIYESLKPLFSTWQGAKYLEKLSHEELLEHANEAQKWTLDKIIESD